MFRHAAACGARVFDGTKVAGLTFSEAAPARPAAAQWAHKDGASGEIAFDFLVDASGRAGLVSARYLKTRVYNQGLKNVAMWGYWAGAGVYAEGTPRANSPFFEALQGAFPVLVYREFACVYAPQTSPAGRG